MIPAEHIRGIAVITELVNASLDEGGGIDQRLIEDIRKRYGMTYPRPVTGAEVSRLRKLAARFDNIFPASENALAEFANREMGGLRFSPSVNNHGEGYGWHIHFYDDNFDFVQRVNSAGAMGVMSLLIHGETGRLKRCAAPTCSKAFLDTTRNLSKVYCDTRTCGNRTNVAAFRQRQ